jgi:hypothetical protein
VNVEQEKENMMGKPIPPEIAQQIASHVFAGQKLQAIKLYQEHSGMGLKECKDFVDSLETELRGKQPGKFTAPPAGKGCLGMVAVFGLGSLAVVVVLVMVLHG